MPGRFLLVVLATTILLFGVSQVNLEQTQPDTSSDETINPTSVSQNTLLEQNTPVPGHLTDVHQISVDPPSLLVEAKKSDNDVVPITAATASHLRAQITAGENMAVTVEITHSLDSGAPSMDYISVPTVTDNLPGNEATASGGDMELTQEEEQVVSKLAAGSVPGTISEELGLNLVPDKSFLVPPDTESMADLRPNLYQILEHVPHSLSDSQTWAPSERDSFNFEIPFPTEALKPVSTGTVDDVSKLSVGLDRMDVRSHTLAATSFIFEEENGQKKGEEDFPTFDKWSVQYLAEQEKQKSEQKQELLVSPGQPTTQKKLRQNFAAATCGAKIVTSNAEAENAKYLLNRNPDEYMISPCKAKKWFVVELCEPVQVHRLELGSLELFSSLPKSFQVSVSQRYPTKEWMPLGKYIMNQERTIQSFSVPNLEEFVKFVRVEMLEHYGDEHYCPLTSFRVMGVDMVSEDEEDDHEVIGSGDDLPAGNPEEEELEESVNLFLSAKDMVVRLVRKVLYKGDSASVDKETIKPTIDNVTAKVEPSSAETEPCSDKSLTTTVQDSPSVYLPAAGEISAPPAEELPIVTKLADTEQLPTVKFETPIIVKLDKDSDAVSQNMSLFDSLDSSCAWNAYIQMIFNARLYSSTCPVLIDSHLKSTKASVDTETPVVAISRDEPSTSSFPEKMPSSSGQEQPTASTLAHNGHSIQPLVGNKDLDQPCPQPGAKEEAAVSVKQVSIENGAKITSTVVPFYRPSQEPVFASQSTNFLSSGVSVTKSQVLEPSSAFAQVQADDASVSLMTPGLDIQQSQVVEHTASNLIETMFLKVSPSPTVSSEDSVGKEENAMLESPTVDQLSENRVEDSPPKQALDSEHEQGSEVTSEGQRGSEQTKSQVPGKNETAGSKAFKSIDLVKVGLSPSAKKDMTIVKLNNRIMALEQNVSMTKKYLEELSRAFKQQNEDLMKLLNKTEKKLNVFGTQSEERDSSQQAHLEVLQQRVVNLSQVVDSMHLEMGLMDRELRNAQYLLGFVQILFFLWLTVSSLRSRSKPCLLYTDHQFLLDTMPTKPTLDRSDNKSSHRRNSDLAIHSQPEAAAALKRQASEANIASLGSNNQQSLIPGTILLRDISQVTKKRKKKKMKQSQLSLDLGSSPGQAATQSPSFSSSAGVLFGTDHSFQLPNRTDLTELEDSSSVSSKDKENLHVHFEKPANCQWGICDYNCSCHSTTGSRVLKERANETIFNLSRSAIFSPPSIKDKRQLSRSATCTGRFSDGRILGQSNVGDIASSSQCAGYNENYQPRHSQASLVNKRHEIISQLTAQDRSKSISLCQSTTSKLCDISPPASFIARSPSLGSTNLNHFKGKQLQDLSSQYECQCQRTLHQARLHQESSKRRRSASSICSDFGGQLFSTDSTSSETGFKFLSSPPKPLKTFAADGVTEQQNALLLLGNKSNVTRESPGIFSQQVLTTTEYPFPFISDKDAHSLHSLPVTPPMVPPPLSYTDSMIPSFIPLPHVPSESFTNCNHIPHSATYPTSPAPSKSFSADQILTRSNLIQSRTWQGSQTIAASGPKTSSAAEMGSPPLNRAKFNSNNKQHLASNHMTHRRNVSFPLPHPEHSSKLLEKEPSCSLAVKEPSSSLSVKGTLADSGHLEVAAGSGQRQGLKDQKSNTASVTKKHAGVLLKDTSSLTGKKVCVSSLKDTSTLTGKKLSVKPNLP